MVSHESTYSSTIGLSRVFSSCTYSTIGEKQIDKTVIKKFFHISRMYHYCTRVQFISATTTTSNHQCHDHDYHRRICCGSGEACYDRGVPFFGENGF